MTGTDNLCMNCMSDTAGKAECPNCGFRSAEPQMRHALPYRAMLQERYLVGRAKQSNGEGITYIGYDTKLRCAVELREFFPQTLCERTENGVELRVTGGNEVAFSECLSAFLACARGVAHLRGLSPIVSVYDIFEGNHTAYHVSEWSPHITLRYFVEHNGKSLSWNAARPLFMPVLSALSAVHRTGVCHLGISPETLRITRDGKMRLGEFCISTVRRVDTDLPPDLVPGCAAIEQYVADYVPNEATDVYGFAASLFFALTGSLPQDALKRRADARLLVPTETARSLPPHVMRAVANALQVSPEKRTITFERLRAELSAAPTLTAAAEEPDRPERADDVREEKPKGGKGKKNIPNFVWVLFSCLIALIVFTAVGIIWIFSSGNFSALAPSAQSSSPESAAPESAENSVLMQSAPASDPNMIQAPNLVGQNYSDLVAAASTDGTQEPDYQILESTKQFSDTVPEGCIISQSPAPNTQMAKGTEIVVVVSGGAAIRVLPDISGKTLAEASKAAADAGFVPKKAETYSDTVAEGSAVGYKDAKAGDQKPYGASVTILISKGRDPNQSAPAQ